jgi:hypothetical protein
MKGHKGANIYKCSWLGCQLEREKKKHELVLAICVVPRMPLGLCVVCLLRKKKSEQLLGYNMTVRLTNLAFAAVVVW